MKAARAACVIATENGLAEARMYAMMHAAVHETGPDDAAPRPSREGVS